MAQTIADFDRSTLGPKTRVHALAKQLGMTSKELIVALDDIGLVKVAQSNLSLEEANKLLDALQPPATKPTKKKPAKKRAKKEKKDKIRQRVEKNVANEIHQIEEKVERELSDLLVDPEPEFELEPEPQPQPEPDAEHHAPLFAPIFLAPEPAEEVLDEAEDETSISEEDDEETPSKRKRRGRRGKGRGRGVDVDTQEEAEEPTPETTEPVGIKGSTRLEAQRRRRSERREEERKKRHIVSEAEFLARRESVDRVMVVREKERSDHPGMVTQVGVLEDGLLVEHFVTSETQNSLVGNIYLGRVQNVLPSMEAAFIDIGKGRNGVLYAGEVDWRARGLGGKRRKIEEALRSGDQVLVQVTKDPVGQKGARLTTQISLAGRYLVYVPGGRTTGISRKLPENERKRLKNILNEVVPDKGGAIIRTAAEGVHEHEIAADVRRLHSTWEAIQERAEEEKTSKGSKPVTLYEEPNMLVKVIRDLFNEDFGTLVVDGERAWNVVHAYVQSVAPDLLDRLERYNPAEHGGQDAFVSYRIDEQLDKALARKVWLPSGGTLVIDRTEAMTVIDVNTGKFTGSGGDLEETITRNNLEAAEEIVRQMRLRDLGGMIVVDFIDMVLPENQDLVLRRLTETLGRDRTRHQVSEVTSLGLVQMTRKKLGTGLIETFSTECEACEGRGIILHTDPVEHEPLPRKRGKHPVAVAMQREESEEIIDAEVIDEVVTDTAAPTKPSIEELAAAVVADEEEDAPAVEPAPEPTPAGRRRGRRRSRKNTEVVESPVETSAEEPTQTYEEALAEYEASPRRRRATRGNSRSDIPPRAEDFVRNEAVVEETAAEETGVVETGSVETGSVSSRRNRRRAVRRMSQPAAVREAASVASTQVAEDAGASTSVTRGRGRRRAVRKRTAK